jgi:hypothetical protein
MIDDDDDYSSSSKNRRIADLSLSLPFLLSPRQPSADTPRDDDDDEDDDEDEDDDVFKKFPRPRRAVRYRIRSFQSPQNPTPRIR